MFEQLISRLTRLTTTTRLAPTSVKNNFFAFDLLRAGNLLQCLAGRLKKYGSRGMNKGCPLLSLETEALIADVWTVDFDEYLELTEKGEISHKKL